MKLLRLQNMSTDEILYRIKERCRREADRVRYYLGSGNGQDREFTSLADSLPSSFKTYLERGPAGRFYTSVQSAKRDAVIGMMWQHWPDWIDRSTEEADRLLSGRVDLLSHSGVDLGAEIDWQRDPISGFRWEPRFWADYDLVNSRSSDPKIVHELNRQQHLPRLARAFFITGNEEYAREAVRQMERWIDQNPKWRGVNWQSSLEIAIRSISWMWTLFMLLRSKALEEAAAVRISRSLFSQIDHIYRYPSIYSSPNTHLIGEAAAVFMAGLLFQELPRAAGWRRFGAAVLVKEMERQVSGEGIYKEASTYYHCYAADFYLHAMVLAQQNRFTFPDWMWKRLANMLEYAMHLTRADGSIPLIGDDDGGRVLAIANRHYGTFQDGLSSGAVLFGRADFKYQAGGFAEESLWLLGEDAWAVFESVESRPPAKPHRAYAEAGCFIQRSGWGAADSHVTFDCGDLGMLSGGHGHADALSLTLFTSGRELLIDPATSVYNCAPEWRNYFRSTRGHNTVVVDGLDQSEPGDTFSWKAKSNARVLRHIDLPGIEYIDAEHDGYERLPQPVTHRRRLVHISPDYWIVLDDLRGRGVHSFEFLYHFAPETELFVFGNEGHGEVDCTARLKAKGMPRAADDAMLHVLMYGSSAVQAEALCAQYQPVQGWSSLRYGERRPSPVLRATMREHAPASMMTFLAPGSGNGRSHRLHARAGHSIAAAIRVQDFEDIAVQPLDGGCVQLKGYSMRGEFFWIRTRNGEPLQVLAVNAKSFSLAGQPVFESEEAIPYMHVHFWDESIGVCESGPGSKSESDSTQPQIRKPSRTMVIERGGREGEVYVRDLRDLEFQRK